MSKLRKSGIYMQFLALAAASLMIFTLFFVVYGGVMVRNMRAQTDAYVTNMVSQLGQTVQQNYTTFAQIMKLAGYNSNIQEFLLSENEAQRIEAYSRAKQDLSDFATLNSAIRDIILVDNTGNRYGINDHVLYELPTFSLSGTEAAVSGVCQQVQMDSSYAYLVTAQNIYSISNYTLTNQIIGRVYLVLSADAFLGGEVSTLPVEGVQMFLLDRDGAVLWSSAGAEETDYGSFAARHTDSLCQEQELIGGSLRLTAFADSSLRLENSAGLLVILVGLSLLLLAAGFAWIVWARQIVGSLTTLTAFVEKVGRADLTALPTQKILLEGSREVTVLSAEISHMLEQIYQLTRELVQKNADLYEAELLAKQSELSSLRSQINPHFLYNTLETMVGIAYTEGQPKVAKVARALSLIFEYSIKGKPVVTLREELKAARNYLLIQGYRFGDRVRYTDQIAADVQECLVPKMILQPLIENAVVHGMEEVDRPCMLTIRAMIQDGLLLLEVADDGCGIGEKALLELQSQLRASRKEENVRHIGLCNVNNRIRLMYGEPYGVRIESRTGVGTTVRITLPARKEGSGDVSGNDRG